MLRLALEEFIATARTKLGRRLNSTIVSVKQGPKNGTYNI